jgi:hypothetical protein
LLNYNIIYSPNQMTTWLSEEAVAQKAFPYSWTLSATEWDGTGDQPWNAASDGYKIVATMGWTKLGEDSEDASGTSGACVAANGADGNVMATGSPIVCTLLNTDGNQASVGSVTTLGVDGWGDNFKGSSRGDAVEHTANLDAMKLIAAIVDGDDKEGEPEEDEFEEDLQADDGDGWAETASDAIDDG